MSIVRTYQLLLAGVAVVLLTGCPTKKAPPTQYTPPQPAATAPKAASGDEIPIGSIMCNTGSFATFGQSSTKAMRMAVDEINGRGGVLGRNLKLLVEDDQCKPEEAANAAQKLIQQNQVLCIVGEVVSSNSLAAAPICQAAGVPMVSPASTNPQVTQVGDCIFRVCFTDDFQGLVMARFAAEKLKAKTAVIISDTASDYSQGLSEVFTRVFEAAGGKVLGEESFSQGDKDFRAQLTKLKDLNPDVLYVPAYYGDVAPILSQARQLGLRATGLGGDGWDSPKLVEVAGDAAEGGYFSNHYSKDDPNPVVQGFVAGYHKRYHEDPDALAALAYDAVRVVTEALERAGQVDRKALRDAIAQTVDFDGVTGKITIDPQRNAHKSAAILTIKGGKQAFVQTMEAQ